MIVPKYQAFDTGRSYGSGASNKLLFEALTPLLKHLYAQGSLHNSVTVHAHHFIGHNLGDRVFLFLPGDQISLVIKSKCIGNKVGTETLEEGEGCESLIA